MESRDLNLPTILANYVELALSTLQPEPLKAARAIMSLVQLEIKLARDLEQLAMMRVVYHRLQQAVYDGNAQEEAMRFYGRHEDDRIVNRA